MRDVYLVAGGVTRFARAQPRMDFRTMVKEAYDLAMGDVPELKPKDIGMTVCSYFSDHFTRQLMAGAMVQDYLGLCPKPSRRVEGGGATGGLAIHSAYEAVASGRADVCLACGFETMSRVSTRKGNEIIALASDTNFDYPLGGFYTAYYAMMAVRRMHEFGTTADQMALVSVKNHGNAIHNPFAQAPARLTVGEVRSSGLVAWPLTRLDCSLISDGAAVAILCDRETAFSITDHPVLVKGVGAGTDTMRMADRPRGRVIPLPHERAGDYRGLKYPGVHSCRADRMAAKAAYAQAGIRDPREELDFAELYDAYTSAEIQAYEDLGLCRYGEGGSFVEKGRSALGGDLPINPSGGLLGCGHPIGATGLMQAVFALWQLQGKMKEHLGSRRLQVRGARRGLVHSHGGPGTYSTVTVLERAE